MTNPKPRERDDERERSGTLDKAAAEQAASNRAKSAERYKQKVEELNRTRDREIERTLRGL